jgi:hypothetical protein
VCFASRSARHDVSSPNVLVDRGVRAVENKAWMHLGHAWATSKQSLYQCARGTQLVTAARHRQRQRLWKLLLVSNAVLHINSSPVCSGDFGCKMQSHMPTMTDARAANMHRYT